MVLAPAEPLVLVFENRIRNCNAVGSASADGHAFGLGRRRSADSWAYRPMVRQQTLNLSIAVRSRVGPLDDGGMAELADAPGLGPGALGHGGFESPARYCNMPRW